MATSTKTPDRSGTGLTRQVGALVLGAATAFVGALIAIIGALSCMAGCTGLTPGILVAFGGLAVLATSPFVISRVSNRDRWFTWGALGLGAGTGAFLLGRVLARVVEGVAGADHSAWTVILPSFGLAAAVALPARGRWLIAARVAGVLILSMFPAIIRDGGVLVRFITHTYPDGSRTMGWEDHGGFLVSLALAGVPAGLFLPAAVRRRANAHHPASGSRP